MRDLVKWLSLATLMTVGLTARQLPFTQLARDATAILYSQDEQGGMQMLCTVTAFAKDGDTYKFVSAAHCVGNDDTAHERVAAYRKVSFYVTFDHVDQKVFYTAKAVAVGYQHRGDDFSVFEVKSKETWPIVPVGDERKEQEGNAVLNIASPLGLGKQVFHGSISKMELDRPIIDGDINWKGTMLLQLPGVNGGSSGSSILSEKQEAIVAFLVGTIGGTTITAIPASRFTEFMKRVADGKYRWMSPEEDQ